MIETRALLDAAKSAQGIGSDYRLARTLGCTDTTIHNYRHGKTHPDEVQSLQLAAMAGLDPSYVLVSMAAQRAKTEAARAHFERAAVALRSMVAPGGNTPPGSHGSGNLPTPSQGAESPANPDGYGARAVSAAGSPFYTSSQVSPALPMAAAAPLGLLGAIVQRRRRLSACK